MELLSVGTTAAEEGIVLIKLPLIFLGHIKEKNEDRKRKKRSEGVRGGSQWPNHGEKRNKKRKRNI